jgi:hypothetical protein
MLSITKKFQRWGRTEVSQRSDVKIKLDLEVRTTDYCNSAYRGTTLTIKQMCAGGIKSKFFGKGLIFEKTSRFLIRICP